MAEVTEGMVVIDEGRPVDLDPIFQCCWSSFMFFY
jgi:hypothetical protein